MSIQPPTTEFGFISLLREFRGEVFGLVGVLLGAFLVFCIQRWGRIYLRERRPEFLFRKRDDTGQVLQTSDSKNAESAIYLVGLEFYNSKSHPTALASGVIEFRDARNVVFAKTAFDTIDLPPGQMIRHEVEFSIEPDSYAKLRRCNRVFLVARTGTGRRFKARLRHSLTALDGFRETIPDAD